MDRLINIALISLNEKFCISIGESFAESLDMFHVNCEEMIMYDLTSPKEVIEKCGLEYFKKRERSVVRNCSEYVNTVITVSYNLFKSYKELFKNSLVVYIQLPQEKCDKVPNEIDYQTRNEFAMANSQIVISLTQKSIKKCMELLHKKIGEYYENC